MNTTSNKLTIPKGLLIINQALGYPYCGLLR